MVRTLFHDKYASFEKYIEKFGTEMKNQIKKVIAAEQHYADINIFIFKGELRKWGELLSSYP